MTRVLHLFGNWKWTGPADPVLRLVRALGPEAGLLIGPCPHADLAHAVRLEAERLGVEHRVLPHLRKHLHPWHASRAAALLTRQLERRPADVLHVHFDADHAAAARARRALRPRPVLVRTVHERDGNRRRHALAKGPTDLLLAPSRSLAEHLAQDLDWPKDGVGVLETGVDLDRFRFQEERRDRGRRRLGLAPEDFVVGVVARVQRHRRYELLVDAWTRLKDLGCRARLLVLGRGTHEQELLHEPVRQRGLQETVLRPGYQSGDDYLDALAACDVGLFLVPGSDVSCRAVREWMAMGRGVLASRRAPLPDLITDGQDGLLIEEEAAALAEALAGPEAPGVWAQRGARARETAVRRFSMARMADHAQRYYRAARRTDPDHRPGLVRPASHLAVVRPGALPDALAWAAEEGGTLELLAPDRCRDVVWETLDQLAATGARNLLISPHPEWDATLLRELRGRPVRVQVLRPQPASDLRDRWLDGLTDGVFRTGGAGIRGPLLDPS